MIGQEIKDLVEYTYAELLGDNYKEYVSRTKFKYNPRFTRRIACCKYHRNLLLNSVSNLSIEFGPLFYELKNQERTIIHEACHAVAAFTNIKRVHLEGYEGHGNYWGSLMRKMGLEPTRYCQEPVVHPNGASFTCLCQKTHAISPIITKKIRTQKKKYKVSCCGAVVIV